jgi:hypothetical protein
MKKTLIVGLILIGFGLFTSHQLMAQTAWTVSKDVQKVANKELFSDEELMKSHIHAMSLNQSWVVSKGVSNVGRTETAVATGNIRSSNNDWAISKGVHRVKASKPAKENKDLFKTSPAITRDGK